jgi:hypothetical protein
MSDAVAPTDVQLALARYDLDLANIRKALDEATKLAAERAKLDMERLKFEAEAMRLRAAAEMAGLERQKLRADTLKVERDIAFSPYERTATLAASLIGAVAGLAALAAHFIK